ncbi:MAG: rRNA pseudouridine synthase [Alphaproteobacteria bacterium]
MQPDKHKLAQRIAAAGLASRREAELWIQDGKVECNGQVITTPATRVAASDKIRVHGKPLPNPPKPRLWQLYKPRGILVARNDPKHRCLPELLPKALRQLHPIGRLDLDSEGLLLLTNTPRLKQQLENPDNAVPRRYRMRVFGQVRDHDLARLARGPRLNGRKTAVLHITRLKTENRKQAAANTWLAITLTEGRNRELRRLATLCGWQVNRLIRTHYANFSIARLRVGELREVPAAQVARLLEELQNPQAVQKKSQQKRAQRSKPKPKPKQRPPQGKKPSHPPPSPS